MNTDDFRILLAEGKQKKKKFWAIVKDEGNEELRVYYGPISMQDMRILLTDPSTARERIPHRIKVKSPSRTERQFDRKIQEKVDRDYELLFPEHQQHQAIKALLYASGENVEEKKGVEEEAQDSSAPEPEKRSWKPDEEFVWF